MRQRLLPILWFLLVAASQARALDTATGIFSSDFRTLTVKVNGSPMLPPILTLGSDDRLTIGFDQLADDRSYLRYSILHCNADWQPSVLADSELFDGFNFADIDDFDFSRGTSVHYVHYAITLPNDNFRFRVSGNYLLRVYPENAPDDILLQVRFMVSEATVKIDGEASGRTDIDYRASHQQLSLTVEASRQAVRDLFNDLQLFVGQNSRRDNAVAIPHPSRVQGTTAIYEHLPALIFPAGNEYRRMETISTTYPGMGVETIDYRDPYYNHYLQIDRPRFGGSYSYDQTQHGRFLLRNFDADREDADTEADYTVVHFALDQLEIPDRDVFIEGDITNRRLDPDSQMRYNPSTGRYERALLLKQGAYNYQFVTLPKGVATPNSSPTAPRPTAASTDYTEGNFYPTVNEYLVTVYYRAPSDRADRLLGYSLIFSGR